MTEGKKYVIVVIGTSLALFVIFLFAIRAMEEKIKEDNAITYISAPATENLVKEPEAIELNSVTFEELAKVENIGRKLARNIIDYREKIGGFTTIRQLLDVPAIDTDTYNLIKNKLYVEGERTKFEEEQESDIASKVNINTATVKELMTVPSITQSLAQKIVEYREKNGDFVSINEIKDVNGIGEIIFDDISDYITV
ncbi:MAG: hypothetical protein E7490_02335 [Ruminococcaceae bacterium]|nr:hypothetical protein [Oscillospiraceae bacterium]